MPGTIPIYDFYNAGVLDHLTTPNRNETDGFQGREYRGIAFYAYDHQVSGTVPIYSFYHYSDTDHFISPNRNATDGLPNWEYRGIVFYAFSTCYWWINYAATDFGSFDIKFPNYGNSIDAVPAPAD